MLMYGIYDLYDRCCLHLLRHLYPLVQYRFLVFFTISDYLFFFFFFQAEDGIRDVAVMEFRRVLFRSFVRTMVAGATGIDAALLVVAADEGVMPQTREHLSILGLLGTHAGVVSITKADLVDEDWLALVSADVTESLRGTPLEDATIVPTSVTTGAGLEELRQALGAVIAAIPARDAGDTFRMPIDRAFSVRGTGTVVTGTVWQGTVKVGDSLVAQPSGKNVRVRGVQAHGTDVDHAL